MAVIAVWQCDRDGAMFKNKKDADDHDKMLELAENITALIEQHITGLDESQAEAIGLVSLIAKPFADAPYELGIVLKAASRGADYAVEALTALFLHCFTQNSLRIISFQVSLKKY